MVDDPIEPEDENEALEWRASEQVYAHDQEILALKVRLQQLKVERNRWANWLTSIRVARLQMHRARHQMSTHSSCLDAPYSPSSSSSSGPPTQV